MRLHKLPLAQVIAGVVVALRSVYGVSKRLTWPSPDHQYVGSALHIAANYLIIR
jgi:hypothetical protein